MKLAEFSQSIWGKVIIGGAIFAFGYYFPLFHPTGSLQPPSAQASAPSAGVSGAR